MTCCKIERLIIEYLTGELSPSKKILLEKHFLTCKNCQATLVEIRIVLALSQKLPVPQLPDFFWEKQKEKLAAVPIFPRIQLSHKIWAISSFFVLVCLLTGAFFHRNQTLANRLPRFVPGAILLPSEEGIIKLVDMTEETEPDYFLEALLKQ